MSDLIEDRVALIDLDGTVADFDNEMTARMAKLQAPGEQEYTGGWGEAPDYIHTRRNLIKSQPGFWRDLPKIKLGFEVVQLLRGLNFNLHVLTKGPKSTPSAWSEKIQWCQEHLPDALVTVTQDKSLVYGRVLVDDFPPYFEKWLLVRPRGIVIAVAHPWNVHIKHPNVTIYDGSQEAMAKVVDALKGAYTRTSGRQEA